ncbi:phage tail fiber protein [Acinetobacter baumannii]
MTIQTVNLGTAPTGAGGDTFRSTGAKMNENFTNWSHAASRYVGTAAGNVMEVGAFGLGGYMTQIPMPNDTDVMGSGFYYYDAGTAGSSTWQQVETNVFVLRSSFSNLPRGFEIGVLPYTNKFYLRSNDDVGAAWRVPVLIRHSGNTTIDANGFIKAASPIVKLFAEKIELNEEAAEQNITFEKLDVGHYLLKGTSGFATEGWYIETPKDANGNILFAVIYQQLENKDIEIKTFKKKFDVESASIIADLDNPVDISTGRWIDIRLQEIPKPVPEMPVVTENDPE